MRKSVRGMKGRPADGVFFVLRSLFASVVALAVLSGAAAEPASGSDGGPLLAELFTSQGCSSCPPAETLFAELADDPGLVTIEWHVDYWDSLNYGGSRWKDPFSSAANTARQRAYNSVLRGTSAVYTPQGVLGGQTEFVGSRKNELAAARKAVGQPSVRLTTGARSVSVSGAGRGNVIFVRLQDRQETRVTGGENSGRLLHGRHIALERRQLGRFGGKPATFALPALGPGETCAIFVQQDTAGPVLGATYCPAGE